MDGLSAAASGIAVASLAVQLADSLAKLYSFFEALKSASSDAAAISNDLRLLSEIVRGLQLEEANYRTLLDHLKGKIHALELLVAEAAEGFSSARKRDRHRSAFKVVKAGATFRKLKLSLEETKSTLILSLQTKTLARNAISPDAIAGIHTKLETVESHAMRRIDDLHAGVADLTKRFDAYNVTISLTADVDEHKSDVLGEVEAVAAHAPQALTGAGFVSAMSNAVDIQFEQLATDALNIADSAVYASGTARDTATTVAAAHHASLERTKTDLEPMGKPTGKPTKSWAELNLLPEEPISKTNTTGTDVPAAANQWGTYTVTDKTLLERSQLEINIFIGRVSIVTEIWRLRKLRTNQAVGASSTDVMEMRTAFSFHPAAWLVHYGFGLGFVGRMTQQQNRPVYSLEPFRAVRDDAPVFDFAYAGNLDALKVMFERGLASVLDTDSRGWTPLAWAAYGMDTSTIRFLLDHNSNKEARVRSHRDKEQANEYYVSPFLLTSTVLIASSSSTIIELASGTRGIEHGGKPMGHHLARNAEPVEVFGPWADDISFDANGSGWLLLISLIGSSYKALSLDALAPIVSWVLRQHHAEVLRGIEKSPRRFEDMIHRALWAGRLDIINTIWNDLGPPSSQSSFDGFGGLHRLICRLAGEVHDHQICGIAEAVGELLAHDYDPHILGKELMYSQFMETPLSCSMYSPGAFWHWRNLLQMNGVDIREYVETELRIKSGLVESGWTKDALLAIFQSQLAPSFYNERSTCRRCRKNFFFSHDSWWEERLQYCRKGRLANIQSYDQSREWMPMTAWAANIEIDYFKGWIQIVEPYRGSANAISKATAQNADRNDQDPNVELAKLIEISTVKDTMQKGRNEPYQAALAEASHQATRNVILGADAAQYLLHAWSYRPLQDQLCNACRAIEAV